MKTDQLTFTRFIAALLIVFFHFAGNILRTESLFINTIRENFFLGVSYFYVLSGFVMILAYGDQPRVDNKKYLTNRIARLYPLHLFTLALTVIISILIAINYLEFFRIDIRTLILNATLLHAWIPDASLTFNVPSWSISVEMFFYLIFPFVFNYLFRKMSLASFAVFVLLFWMASQVLLNVFYTSSSYGGYNSADRYFIHYNPLFHVSSFLVGILSAALFKKYSAVFSKNFDLLIVLTFAVTLIMIYLCRDYLLHNGLMALNFAIIIILIAGNTGKITQLFRHKFLIHLGNISFALYLLQNPVFILLRKIFKVINIQDDYIILLVGLPLLLLSSHLTYRWIEIPCQKKIRNLLQPH